MLTTRRLFTIPALLLCLAQLATAQDAITVRIDPSHALKPVARYLSCACIEDVNHEIYGGLYSQMIFGESFQEPPLGNVAGFVAYGGDWNVRGGILDAAASDGAKLVHDAPDATSVGVDIYFPDDHAGNAGLIIDVRKPGVGADRFAGYEISLDPATKTLRLARHQQNYRLLRDVPCDIATNRWITLAITHRAGTLDVAVDGKSVLQYEIANGAAGTGIGVRAWQRAARFRNLWTSDCTNKKSLAFESAGEDSVSGMWRLNHQGDAVGMATWIDDRPFVGAHDQRISMTSGAGQVGIANRGLNRQGMGLLAGRPYQGHLWARAAAATKIRVSFTSTDAAHVYATQDVSITDQDWHRYDFNLTPDATDATGSFEIALTSPGSVDLGYVLLEPGSWGTFKGLPVRNDVAAALIDEGIVGLRYGGSMVNAPEYRWKKMIGERDRRPPYRGTWYEHSSNGWGIVDFISFCEAANILPIPDFNINETAQDMADFIEYANGPADSAWAARAADGHPAPYGLTHIELGNEERVDEAYFKKFDAIARAIWAKDPRMILTVGDFGYHRPIVDAMHIEGADSHISNLSAHKQILDLARQFDAEVWFDIHVWTEEPLRNGRVDPFPTYIDAIDKLAGDAKHHVVIFELNANNHFQRRALANAQTLLRVEQDGRLPFVSSANGLQVDKQNDNGWDQGLLFMNPSKVWLQPPGYVAQMFSRNSQPTLIECSVSGEGNPLSAVATASEDRNTVVLQALNPGDKPATATIDLTGWDVKHERVSVQTLAGDLNAANTADAPTAIQPTTSSADAVALAGGHTFPPHSFTVIRWTRADAAH